MKLHLNLTLRRALMAAMAMVALHTAEAALTTQYNGLNAYIYGDGPLTSNTWNDIWNKHKSSTLTIGNYQGTAVAELEGSTYNKGGDIYIGGVGYDSNTSVANNGELIVNKLTKLNVNALNVGNSQVGGVGTLTVKGGAVSVNSSVYVGVNAGSGIVNVTDGGSITIASGSTGAVFAMSHRTTPGLEDTVTLTGSTITVGAKGGVLDYTAIGHSAGTATLNLEAGSTATFNDQLLVGEKSGSDGTIHVHGSTLNMGTTTVLGYEANATGTICLEDGIAKGADTLVLGSKGNGIFEMSGASSLSAKSIELGDAASSYGFLGNQGTGTITTDLLTIGTSGSGSVYTTGTLTAKKIVIGKNETGYGYLTTEGTVTTDTLYAGEKGTGIVSVEGGTLTAKDAYIVGINSELATEAGKTTLTNATVLAGELSTAAGATTEVTGELIVAEAGQLVNSGTTNLNTVAVTKGSSIQADGGTLTAKSLANDGTIATKQGAKLNITELDNFSTISNGGELTTGSATNWDSITNTGTWNATGKTTSTDGTIANDGTLNVSGELTTGSVSGTGTADVATNGKWNITSDTLQSTISNSGDIVITGAGYIKADKMEGSGDTTIVLDGTTVSTGPGVAVIELTEGMENVDKVKVAVDTVNASQLVGKQINFLEQETDVLTEIAYDNFSVTGEGDKFIWESDYIELGKTERTNEETGITTTITEKLNFTESNRLAENDNAAGTTHLYFSRYEVAETTSTDLDLNDGIVSIDLEVKTETVISATENVAEKAVTSYEQEIPEDATAEEKKEIEEQNKANIAASEVVDKAVAVNKAEVATGNTITDATTGETKDETINVLVGKDVASTTTNGGSVQVKSTIVNQHTTFESGETLSENIHQSGLTLVFEGDSTHKKDADSTDKAELGFAKETTTGVVTVDGEKREVKKIDIVEVKESANVAVENIDMHATHAITIGSADGAKTTLELNNVDFHVGGETDVNVLHMVRVNVYDENQEVTGTKLVAVESENHLTTKSTITNAEVKLLGTTILKFEELDFGSLEEELKQDGVELNREEIDKLHGNTTITDSEIVLGGGDAQLGETDYTDDEGKEHNYQEIVLEDTKVKGSGKVKNTKMKGGRLTVGSSPGQLTLTQFKAEQRTEIEFFMIADPDRWNANGMNNNTNHETGCISQLVVESDVTLTDLSKDVIITLQVWDDTVDDYTTIDKNSAAAITLGSMFQDGAEIQFISGNLDELTINGEVPVLSESALPTLSNGLFWDTSTLFTDGIVRVYAEILEEPTRVANSMVSAGETVLNFGRLAQNQAALREAGTTRTWGSAIAMFDSIDSGSTTNGYDYSNWGAAVGVDHAFTKNTVVGVAFGCTWGENEAKEDNGYYNGGSIDQDAKMIGIYGVHKFQTKGLLNDVKLSAFAAYGMFENDSTRNGLKTGNKADAEWDSDAWVLSASLSRDITTDSGVVFTPYVGVEYTTAGMDDFTEKGKSYSADYSADEDYSNLSVKVGVGVSKTYGSITPYANVAFISDVDRTAGEVTATGKRTITGKSALPGRNGFELGVGATWQLTENLDVNAGYSAEIRDKATEHNARLGVGYTF